MPVGRPDLPDDAVHYVGLPALPEGQNSHFHGGMQELSTGMEPNRYYGA